MVKSHDHYTESYFQRGKIGSASSAAKIVPELLRLVAPKSVVDVGCGIGTWARQFQLLGVDNVLGVDGPHISRNSLLIDAASFLAANLAEPLVLNRTFDLVLTVEVAEHLPISRAHTFVSDLVALSPVVAFSAAIPGQGGANHINEQWPDYWERHFADFDYIPVDCIRSMFWDDNQVEFWYKQNLILFVKRDHLAKYPKLKDFVFSPRVLRLVHPEMHLRNVALMKVISKILSH